MIYDDGIQDNFAIWATAGNLNALKVTPLAWPAKLNFYLLKKQGNIPPHAA